MNTSVSNTSAAPESLPKPTLFEEAVVGISLTAAVLALLFFAWIANSVSHEHTKKFDLLVRNAVHQYASPDLTPIMIDISFLGGDGLVIASLVSVLLFLRYRKRRAALWLLVTL